MTEPRPVWMTPPTVTDAELRKIKRKLLQLMEQGYGILTIIIKDGKLDIIQTTTSEKVEEK